MITLLLSLLFQSVTPGVYQPAPVPVPAVRPPAQTSPSVPRARIAPAAAARWQAAATAVSAGNYDAALTDYDALVGGGLLSGEALGEAHLDRAMTRAAAGRPAAEVAADLAQARTLSPNNPQAWLLSAITLRRAGTLAEAQTMIVRAAALAPRDAAVALEAGNIAILTGDETAAETNWRAAQALAPGSADANSATANLAELARLRGAPADSATSPPSSPSPAAVPEGR